MHRTILALALLLVATHAHAWIWTVHPDGTGDFPTIQAALDAASSGDVIQLGDGVFTGPGNRDLNSNFLDVDIISMSGDPDLCIIDCQGSAGDPHFGISYGTNPASMILRGITITRAYSGTSGGAIRTDYCGVQVSDCIFSNNTTLSRGGAVSAIGAYTPSFENCRFDWNDASGGLGGAIYYEDECSPVVTSCIFTSNTAINGGAIHMQDGLVATVTSSTFWSNTGPVIFAGTDTEMYLDKCILAFNTGEAVADYFSAMFRASCCCIFGNTGGNYTGPLAGASGIDGNLEVNPVMCNPAGGDYHLHSTSPCAPLSNPSCGQIGALPVGCWTILRVAADGSGQFATIQDALNAAVGDGSEIIELEDGVYYGTGNCDISTLNKPITLRSRYGDPANCILEPNHNGGNAHRGFRIIAGEDPSTVIEGITIRTGEVGETRMGAPFRSWTPTPPSAIASSNPIVR